MSAKAQSSDLHSLVGVERANTAQRRARRGAFVETLLASIPISGDICARRVGEKLAGSSYTMSAAIVENKPGAGGRIALEALKASPTDGSVLAMTPFSPLSLYPHTYSKLS